MGGKVWSEPEERHFWRVAVSQSPKRAGIDIARAEKSWDQLAKDMQNVMGGDARRQYSGTMLFEHFFQNIESQRRSPNAALYVREYLAKRDRTRHIVNDHDHLNPYSASSIARNSRRAEFSSDLEAAVYLETQTPGIAPTGDSITVRSCDGPLVIPGVGFYEATRVMDSIEIDANRSLTSDSFEGESLFIGHTTDDESELEEGEIRE
ncbi:hypothetical protein HD806DRAFT_147234 [Xylariaceae sp. AK1471]|nr:hypothetical protein HD806DRAFT_147234 [Xylariaceae sp. AK1471]